MQIKKVLLSLILLWILTSVSLFAGNKTTQLISSEVIPITKEQRNIYIGLGISYKQMENDLTDESFTSSDLSLILGYKINSYLSIEGHYNKDISDISYKHGNTMNSDIDNYNSSFQSVGIYIKLGYPVKNFEPYLLFGYAQTMMNSLEGDDRTEEDFSWGIGLSYYLNDSWAIYSEYIQLYEGKGFDGRAQNSTISVNIFTTGISYAF